MRRVFVIANCALLAVAGMILVPAWALAAVPSAYTSYGYASGVHEIAGSDAFPNFQNGAVNNRYPLAEVQQDASPSSIAVATYIDSGPAAATGGSQFNQSCSNSGSAPPPPQVCQNPNNQVPYATATYPGGPSHAHVDACNGCGNPPRGDSSASELTANASAVYAGGGAQPFNGAYGSTTTTMGQDGTLVVITHSEVDSFSVGTVQISKVVVDINARATVQSGSGDATVTGGQVTANGQPVAVTDKGVTIETMQPVPCPPAPNTPGPPTGPAPAPSPIAAPSLPVASQRGTSAGFPTSCVPTVDVTYVKIWTVAPTKTISGSHVTIWATGLHVLVTHPSPGAGVPTQTTEYVLGEGYVDLQAGSGGGGFAFSGFGGLGGPGFGGLGDQGGAPGGGPSVASTVGSALLANRVPLALMFLTLEALLLAAAAAWVWARNAPVETVADEILSP